MSSDAFTKLKEDRAALHAMQVQPELAAAKANVAALKDMLHMSDAQVRPQFALRIHVLVVSTKCAMRLMACTHADEVVGRPLRRAKGRERVCV